MRCETAARSTWTSTTRRRGASVTALTELSIAGGGKPVEFPDFTRGGWKTRRPLQVMGV